MALKRTYDSQDDIPEELQSIYVEQDGKWILDAEPGDGERNSEDVRRALRARDNEKAESAKFKKQLEELQERFKDIDPERIEEAKAMQARLDDLEHQKLINEKKFEEAAEKKFQRQLAEMQRTVEKMNQQHEEDQTKWNTLRQKYLKVKIPDQLTQSFLAEGTDPKKLPWLLAAAQQYWELDDSDEPTPIDWVDGGRTKITAVGKDGKTLTMKEQVRSILAENPWAVLESSGSSSTHQGANGTRNPFTMTASEVETDFQRYKKMSEEATKAGTSVEILS